MLNSKLVWWLLVGLTPAQSETIGTKLRVQYVEKLPIPERTNEITDDSLRLSRRMRALTAERARLEIQTNVRRRLLDLAPPERAKLTGRLHDWHELDFAAFRAEIKRAFRADIPVKERGGLGGLSR